MHVCRTTTESGCDGNEKVAVAALETFARWLLHRYASVDLPSNGTYRYTARYILFPEAFRSTVLTHTNVKDRAARTRENICEWFEAKIRSSVERFF